MSTSPESVASSTAFEDNSLWLLKARHEELGSMFRTAWNNYISFYTVFLTFSLGAMGWLVAHKESDPMPRRVHHVIATVLIMQSLLTAITSAGLAMYSHRVGVDYVRTEMGILGTASMPSSAFSSFSSAIPVALGVWAGGANCVAMLGMIGAWIYVGFFM
jgi:uncharacterized membrane protein